MWTVQLRPLLPNPSCQRKATGRLRFPCTRLLQTETGEISNITFQDVSTTRNFPAASAAGYGFTSKSRLALKPIAATAAVPLLLFTVVYFADELCFLSATPRQMKLCPFKMTSDSPPAPRRTSQTFSGRLASRGPTSRGATSRGEKKHLPDIW